MEIKIALKNVLLVNLFNCDKENFEKIKEFWVKEKQIYLKIVTKEEDMSVSQFDNKIAYDFIFLFGETDEVNVFLKKYKLKAYPYSQIIRVDTFGCYSLVEKKYIASY